MWHGLCDCNHFYASCERLYRPDLQETPVIVLSNNDGCIVALTKEAKAIGLARGNPFFQVKEIANRHHVAVFSSNYPLYESISKRVMALLEERVDGITQYSIDESFFTVQSADQAWCDRLWKEMSQSTGMPLAVSVARTKTLAKAGEESCKHTSLPALFVSEEREEEILRKTKIADVWGIGWRNAPKLQAQGIATAWDLTGKDVIWVRKRLGINGVKTYMELKGKNQISIEEPERQSICSGISFGSAITTKEGLKEAASCHCMTLSEKLHQHHLMAGTITLMAFTDRFRDDFICPMGMLRLTSPSFYTPDLVKATDRIIDSVYRTGRYKGCRIWATDLTREGDRQLLLEDDETRQEKYRKQDKLEATVEDIHKRYGRDSLTIGATTMKGKKDLMRQQRLSPHYTTRISDLPVANRNTIAVHFSKGKEDFK